MVRFSVQDIGVLMVEIDGFFYRNIVWQLDDFESGNDSKKFLTIAQNSEAGEISTRFVDAIAKPNDDLVRDMRDHLAVSLGGVQESRSSVPAKKSDQKHQR